MIEFSVDNLGVQPSFVIAFVLSSVKIGDSQGIFVVGERIVSGLFHNFITEWITSRTVLLGSFGPKFHPPTYPRDAKVSQLEGYNHVKDLIRVATGE